MVAAGKVNLFVRNTSGLPVSRSLYLMRRSRSGYRALVVPAEGHGLIADDAGASIHGVRIYAAKMGIGFGAGYKERLCLMQRIQACKIEIAAIHHVNRPSLQHQHVKHIDIAQLGVGDLDKRGDISPQVQ